MSWVLDKDLVDDDHGDQVHVLKHHLHAGQASPQPDPRGKWSSRRFPSSLKVDLVKNVAQFRFRHLLENRCHQRRWIRDLSSRRDPSRILHCARSHRRNPAWGKQNLENHLLAAKDHLLVSPGDLRTHLGWELERSDVPRWSLGFMRFFWSVRCGVPSLVDLMPSRLGSNNMISMGRLHVARLAASSLDRGCSTNRGLLRTRSHLFQLLVFLTWVCFQFQFRFNLTLQTCLLWGRIQVLLTDGDDCFGEVASLNCCPHCPFCHLEF